jgi:hypothetical protein
LIKAIANKRIDLSLEEYNYYKLLSEKYGPDCFRMLFETDQNGVVTSVSPPLDGQTPMAVIFYMLNVMFTQRMRFLDAKISKFEALEKKVDQLQAVANLMERRGDGKD